MGQMFSTGENPSSENSGIGDDQVLVPTRFVWPYGGRRVFLIGSFTRWSEHVPMTPVEGCPTVFQTIYCLSPGYHQYKFYVDGEWRHDEQQPFVSGNNGIVNIVFLTGEPETVPLLLSPEISGNNDAFQRVEHTGLDCGPCGFIWRQISTCIRAVFQGRRGGDVKT